MNTSPRINVLRRERPVAIGLSLPNHLIPIYDASDVRGRTLEAVLFMDAFTAPYLKSIITNSVPCSRSSSPSSPSPAATPPWAA